MTRAAYAMVISWSIAALAALAEEDANKASADTSSAVPRSAGGLTPLRAGRGRTIARCA